MSRRENSTPLLVFTYRRPVHTLRLLESLARCRRLDECTTVVFCDGAKTPEHRAEAAETRRIVSEWARRHGAKTVERSENLGLSRSIVQEVGAACARAGRAIVLEDDLVLRPDFIDFVLQNLDRYRSETEVLQVSGYQYPLGPGHSLRRPTTNDPAPDVSFLPLTSGWGWGIWDRAWKLFDWEAPGALVTLREPAVRRRFDVDGTYPYAAMLEARLAGKNESWGILWQWAVFRANGKVAFPRETLVWNTGFDGTGTHAARHDHTREGDLPAGFTDPVFSGRLRFPDAIEFDEQAWHAIRNYLAAKYGTAPGSVLHKVWRNLKRRAAG